MSDEPNITVENTEPTPDDHGVVVVPVRKPRGFATMTPERIREIASKGGREAQAKGVAHRFTTEEASAAGKKGGLAPHARRGKQKSTSAT
jgi:general stress protein YciG